MELGRALTFIVRVTSADAGEIAGTVERVRTGEKHRFTGLDGLGALIARIVTHETTPSASGSSEEPRQAGAARDQLGDGTTRTQLADS